MGYMDGDILGNEDNLEVANPLSTPEHIVPEVYFDFLFYVLRCISIKYVGVYGVGGWVCCMISIPNLSTISHLFYSSNNLLSPRSLLHFVSFLIFIVEITIIKMN